MGCKSFTAHLGSLLETTLPCENISSLNQKEVCMFTRLLFLNIQPGGADELKRLYTEEIIPSINGATGYMNCMLLEPVDHTDSYIALTVWEKQSNAIAYESSALYIKHRAKILALTTNTPVLKTYTFEPAEEECPVF
jgi:heme-degrading monooxygenase HmoA